MMKLPNFILIGTQKGGTTALYHYLEQHPQIYMSPIKEPGFFDFEGRKPNFCGPGDSDAYRFAIADIEAYCHLFQEVSDEIAIGEATTWYLYSPKAPERIKDYIPKVKLIVILRNPVDRAYSSFMHACRDNREPATNFALALQEEDKRIRKNWGFLWHYKHMGFYATQLKRYYEKFDSNQIKVYLYDDLNEHPMETLKDIFQFLGVDGAFTPKVFTRLNISGIPKSQTLNALLDDKNFLKNFLKPLLPTKIRKQIANYVRVRNFVKPPCSPEVRKELIEIFREEILELQKLIQRDLSQWLLE